MRVQKREGIRTELEFTILVECETLGERLPEVAAMMITFVSVIDSMSEDRVVRFADRPGGYDIPEGPDDIGALIKRCLHAGEPVEITYDDSNYLIVDARPGNR